MKRTGAFGCSVFFIEFSVLFFILAYSLSAGFLTVFTAFGIIFALIGGLVALIVSVSSSGAREKEEKKNFGRSLNLRNTVVGMAKAEGKVDMRFLSTNMALRIDDFKIHLFDLLGKDLLEGTVEGDYFIPTGDISVAIDALFQQFAKWEGGKKV